MTYSKEQIERVFKVYTDDDYTNQAQDILLEFFRQGFIHGQENVKDIYQSHLEWFASYLKERDTKLIEAAQHNQQAAVEAARVAERAKWLPLWDAIKGFDSYFDFDTPLDDSNGFEDTSGVNEARIKLVETIAGLKSQGEQ